jgi:RsiW-degrading membrane proteinase PrsW (M82 family)
VIFFILSVVLSFVPAFFYAWIIYWLDRYEKEPKLLLGGVFVWGAVVATIVTLVVGGTIEVGILLFTSSEALAELSGSLVVAPLLEESLKGVAILLVFLFWRHEFDSILDGIVYAAIVALGFAATENVLYLYFLGYGEEGVSGLLVLFVVRVLLGGWNHPVFTAFIGIGLAVARLNRAPATRWLAPFIGWCTAVFLHALHNTLASIAGAAEGFSGLVVLVAENWLTWLIVFGIILWAIYREGKGIQLYLREEVEQGIISQQHYDTARSWWGASRARLRALFQPHARATRQFYQACGEIAHKKHQLAKMGEEDGNSARIEDLRAQLARLAPQAGV